MSRPASSAGRREWIGLAVLALPCLVYSMDLTVLYLAVPKLSVALEPTSTELLWISDIYGFFLAGSLITMGAIGDRIGRRRLLLLGATAFSLASLLAAFSSSAGMLILSRALLGVAAAALAPSTLSLLRTMFVDERQRTLAVGIWIASFSVGAAIGPLVGGVLLEYFWWGSVFLAALPVMALLLVLGPRLLPESRDPSPARLDVTSAALSILAILTLVYGLKQGVVAGVGVAPAASLAVGAFLAVVFLRRQLRLEAPLVDVALFRTPPFAVAVAAMCLSVFLVAGTEFFVGQYLQLVSGKSPLVAGLWMLPGVGGLVAGSLLAPALSARIRSDHVLVAGLTLAGAGAATLTQLRPSAGMAVLVVGTATIGLGAGAVGTLATDFVVGSAPAERAGSAAAISETSAELGGALGVAILGSVGAAVYRRELDAGAPASLDADELDRAKEGLAAVVGVGGRVSADTVEVAREAFTQALHVSVLTSALVVVAVTATAAVWLRGARSGVPSAESASDP